MTAIIQAVILLLTNLLPAIKSTTAIANTINVLIQILPVLVKEAHDLVQPVKNIIAALKDNPSTSSEQLAQLQLLDAKVDAEFEAAATKALSEDN